MLPSPVDDVPHAARECACRAGHRVDPRELRDLVRLVCATGGVQGHECAPGHEWLTEALDDLRDRSEPKSESDFTTEPSGGDQREPANMSATLEEHPLCNAAAVRVTDEIQIVEP